MWGGRWPSHPHFGPFFFFEALILFYFIFLKYGSHVSADVATYVAVGIGIAILSVLCVDDVKIR
jgi:hypothetical protein